MDVAGTSGFLFYSQSLHHITHTPDSIADAGLLAQQSSCIRQGADVVFGKQGYKLLLLFMVQPGAGAFERILV